MADSALIPLALLAAALREAGDQLHQLADRLPSSTLMHVQGPRLLRLAGPTLGLLAQLEEEVRRWQTLASEAPRGSRR